MITILQWIVKIIAIILLAGLVSWVIRTLVLVIKDIRGDLNTRFGKTMFLIISSMVTTLIVCGVMLLILDHH
jgi:branched-subunit amino acid transport protein